MQQTAENVSLAVSSRSAVCIAAAITAWCWAPAHKIHKHVQLGEGPGTGLVGLITSCTMVVKALLKCWMNKNLQT